MSDSSPSGSVSRSKTQRVGLFNPLPGLLNHYQLALREVLEHSGNAAVEFLTAPSIELGDAKPHQKLQRMVSSISSQRAALDFDGPVIMLWPTFGHVEPVVWLSRHRRAPTFLVVHDPRPIRRQWLMHDRLVPLGAAAARRAGLITISHSVPATEALDAMRWPNVTTLPIPVCATATNADRQRRADRDPLSVSVFGQWKPSRDLDLLRSMATSLSEHGHTKCVIRGAGWPKVAGWDVEDRFLDDDELAAGLATTDVVVIPYREFFQSDIAVRALEAGTAVVGPDHPFLAELYGADWDGLVAGLDGSHWAAAALEVGNSTGTPAMKHRHEQYLQHARSAWTGFLASDWLAGR